MQLSRYQSTCAWICLLAMLCTSQVHLAALQGIAWTGMAATYIQDSGDVSDGIRRTLSGAEPCSLCCVVQNAATQDETADNQAPPPEIRNFLSNRIASVTPPTPCHGGWTETSARPPFPRANEIYRPPS